MNTRGVLIRILAVTGTLLTSVPILVTICLPAYRLISGRGLLLDYLMPAELFPFALIGGAILAIAALLERSHRAAILGGLAASAVALAGTQTYATVSGLASGKIEAKGLPWAIVLTSLAIYVFALLFLIGAGTRFTWRLFINR